MVQSLVRRKIKSSISSGLYFCELSHSRFNARRIRPQASIALAILREHGFASFFMAVNSSLINVAEYISLARSTRLWASSTRKTKSFSPPVAKKRFRQAVGSKT